MEFKSTMFLPTSNLVVGQLCPDQRRMPQIGSLLAEIVSMSILIVRLPLVVIVASPVMMQLITGPCYLDSKSHSLLMNCGQELFSLEDFFASVYACNGHFWRTLAIMGNFLPAGFAQMFLNGMTTMGENSGISTFLPGIASIVSKLSSNDPTEGLGKLQSILSVGRFAAAGLFMKTMLNPIAGAHWIWRMASRIIVQIIQATQAQRSIGSVFWNVIYEGRNDYEDLVARRLYNTCGGFALMAGYTNPMGQMILHYCNAGVKGSIAALDLLSVFTVDLPLIVCVCRQVTGNNPGSWILNHCDSPDGLKPLLRRLIDSPDSCADLVTQTTNNLTKVWDATTAELFAGTTYVSSVLDAFMFVVDGNKAGQCDNFDTNPYVVTLIPEPADYWRACGKTDLCKLRCQQQMEAFDAVKPSSAAIRSKTTRQTVQSLFFPTLNADAYNPFDSMSALSEMDSCAAACAYKADRCIMTAGFTGVKGMLRVAQFCIPSALSQGVSKGGQWDTFGISGLSTAIQFIRVTIPGGWRDTYAVLGIQDELIQICTPLVCSEYVPSDVDPDVMAFNQMQVIGDTAILQTRTLSNGDVSYCLRFQNTQWVFQACTETNVWDQSLYHIVLMAQGQVLLLPFDDIPMQICQLRGVILQQCLQYEGFNRQNVPVKTKGKQSRVSQFMSRNYNVFIASNKASNWLTMLTVSIQGTTANAMVGNSMQVTLKYTLQQGCSLDSCTGCTSLPVQRLCFAAQQCQVARCVGSKVNQLRPLCAVGGSLQALFFTELALADGIWKIIASVLVASLDAVGGILPPKVITWPDQAFYGFVCSMKDIIASQVSILTSAVNGIMQASLPVIMMAAGEATDNNFLATFTLTLMAITKFLFQVGLGPLYASIAAQKILVCQANSLIGAVTGNNAITIGDPAIQSATKEATGMCMTQVHAENAQSLNNGMDSNQAFTSGSTQVISQLGGLALQLPLDMIVHPIDVFFTYVLGVVIGIQDVLQTADQKNCRAPDWTTRVLYRCPCGDQPVKIPRVRQEETYLDGAYWCSSVLTMLDFDGGVKYVWNPFSLAQLKARLGNFDQYLECVASNNDGSCVAPTDPIFQKQQISLLAVYQRCLSNYQAMVWDQGAFVMFNASIQQRLRLDAIMPAQIRDTFNVSKCLLTQKSNGYDNGGCLTDYFLKGTRNIDYFGYSNITDSAPTSDTIDACLTFSGPAASPNPAVSTAFMACLENDANRSGCDIPHMLWSGRSNNKIPVASQHSLNITDPAKKLQLAQGEMNAAQYQVLKVLDRLEKEWTGDGLKITLFSSEGDLLHQYADCMMQGPMGAMVLTPGPSQVEKVIWSRSFKGDSNRTFEIPCTGQRLANRDGQRDATPPYTCGTYARRAVIKHYLRKTYGGGSKFNEGAKDSVIKAVKLLINQTREAWSFSGNFLCTCPNGTTTGWECCVEQSNCATEPCPCGDGFQVSASVACCPSVCQGLAGAGLMAPFSYISGSQVAGDLLNGMGRYLQNDIWTSNDPWLVYDPLGAAAYNDSWSQSQFDVQDAGLFDGSEPVVYYDEIRYPFKSTFWEHCTGLLQQTMWTLPISRSTDKPKGLGNSYDPINGQSNTPNLTYTEEFIQTLTQEAYKSSPLYWHYNVRHTPSKSEVCQRPTPRPPLNNSYFSVGANAATRQGFSSLTLGGLGGADCFCGWWNSPTTCRIPDSLCATMVQILGFSRVCVDQKQIYNASDHKTVLQNLELLLKQQPMTTYPCPAMQISEHWGLMDPATGAPFLNSTDRILYEGTTGFRLGNVDWLFASQTNIINPSARKVPVETSQASEALQCDINTNPSIADHFIDELFPSAQGVRQSLPQSYCTRYGIELARLTVYRAMGLDDAVSQQQSVVLKWKTRCQYKLEELAVCNSFKVYSAAGGPRDASQCPFMLSVIGSMQSSYAVTPGCLVVIWNSPGQDGIYDPCICVPCTNTPNIDIPAQLTTLCRLESFQSLVASDVIPSETQQGVPINSGSFQSLMDKPGLMQINTPELTHWALHTSMRDADMILDWWPDAWNQPVGYHVTPGCSRPGDEHWKTFDTSWRWDTVTRSMVLSGDETGDAFLNRNAFGASGVCRSNNYGMPMANLNTMTVCTMENANAHADPMVPASSTQPGWSDGAENCASGSTSVPWGLDRSINPPRQWTVGTLQHEVGLSSFPANQWGPGCGPYPLQTCITSSDCAQNLTCLSTTGGNGICASLKPGIFECTTHAQCNNDLLCAGDGLCVDGVWQVQNTLKEPISFRTYSQNCPTGNPLDTWGTSIAEGVPDILNASGMCSYRSWFENRRMADRNHCNRSDTCASFDGMQPWNFTAPNRQSSAGQSAFESGVLKVAAHSCDRDYQYYASFVSCTPHDNFIAIFDGDGNSIDPSGFVKDKRTRTYRVGKQLPLIHHADEMMGPTYGFTGVPQTYMDLNLGTSQSAIVPCSSIKVCSLQPRFTVNNAKVNQRLVIDSGVVRGYNIQDLLKCGVFGILKQDTGTCQLDFAVVPLAQFLLSNPQYKTANLKATLTSATYTSDKTAAVLNALSQVPDAILTNYIGGSPSTLNDYAAKSSLFLSLYSSINQIQKPVYSEAGTPSQIYFITQYGAYEVPFAWWFKCGWLAGFPMGKDAVEQSLCSWNQGQNISTGTTDFGPIDTRLAKLLQLTASSPRATVNATLLDLLIQTPGIITSRILSQAHDDYITTRNTWLQMAYTLLRSVQRMCYQQKEYIQAFSDRSTAYQLQRLSQMYDGKLFNVLNQVYTDANNITVCSGIKCLTSILYAAPTTSNFDVPKTIIDAIVANQVKTQDIHLGTTQVPNLPNTVALSNLFSTPSLSSAFWDNLATSLPDLPDGCTQPVTMLNLQGSTPKCLCETWTGCSPALVQQMLSHDNINDTPTPSQAPTIQFQGVHGNQKIDVCRDMSGTVDGSCFLNNGTLPAEINFTETFGISMPVGTVAETYLQDAWDCVQLKCDSPFSNLNGQYVKPTFQVLSMTTKENIVVNEYEFMQPIPQFKYLPWDSQATQNAEQVCCNNKDRFTSQTTYKDFLQIASETSCISQCPVLTRIVSDPLPFQLKTRVVTYTMNSTLQITAELYPCTTNRSAPPSVLFPSFSSSVPPSGIKRVWKLSTTSGTLMDFGISNTYRPDDTQFHLKVCPDTTNGLPEQLSIDDVRTITYGSTVTDKTQAFRNLNTALLSANAGATTSDCIRYGGVCTGNYNKSSATVNIAPWNDAQRTQQCNTLKNDAYFGCMMYPGEQTYPMTQSDYDYYNCKPGSSSVFGEIFGGVTNAIFGSSSGSLGSSVSGDITNALNGQPPSQNNWRLVYPDCMANNANDPCASKNPSYRNMALSGRTVSYQIVTVAPNCELGPMRRCKMVDEIRNLDSIMSACPGTNRSSARYQGYTKLQAYNRINTQLKLPPDILTAASTGPVIFDNIFIGLDPRFACCINCQSTPPACANASQVSVEMRRDLWACLNCPLVSSIQCHGLHNCMLTSPKIKLESVNTLDGWNTLTSAQKAFLTGTDGPSSTALPAIRWLISQILKLCISDVRLPYEIPPFMTSFLGTFTDYNPTPIVKYDAFMQLNALDCGTTQGQILDSTDCTYDTHRRNLRKFVTNQYKVDDGIVIAPGQTLQWKIKRTQMLAQNIPQWELYTSNRSNMFMSDLFDDKWCMQGNMFDNACYKRANATSTIIEMLNPSLLGVFEPRVGCDTAVVNNQRVISAACYNCDPGPPDEYLVMEDGTEMACPRIYTAVSEITLDETAPSNLCSKRPSPASSCTNRHGMLGQTVYDGNPVSDVYRKSTWNSGLFAGLYSNLLFQGKAPTNGPSNLALTPNDIGGHYLRMSIGQTRSGAYNLGIQAIPLSSYPDAMGGVAYSIGLSSNNAAWVKQANFVTEADRFRTLYPNSICAAWDCPLRRRAFYMGTDVDFRPQVPDPLRTQILYNTRAHPTQIAMPMPSTIDQTTLSVLGVYFTSNGFCACMFPPCLKCSTDVEALTGKWTASSTLPEAKCAETLDWPYAGGTLRDGSVMRQKWAIKAPCGILDRLPYFKYRYINSQTIPPTTKTTLDKGGVCHMGWPVVTAGPLYGCYILGDSDTFMCPAFPQPKNITRLRAKRIDEMLRASTRPRLADCNPPPSYQFGNGAPTASEVSYGQLKRWEASRLLANDLRRRLCGNSTVCAPAKQWSLPTFWTKVFAAQLPTTPRSNGADTNLWSKPWVTCNQSPNGTQECEGTIDRQSWATGNRGDLCYSAVTTSSMADSLTQNINVCDLDSQMDLFCRTIQDARYRIFEANCLYSGQCRQKLFFYQPSTYEIDNTEFVRSTVQKFYNATIAGACMPDQDTARQILINAQNLDKCAATKLNVLADCIQLVRVIVGSLVELGYYIGELMLFVFQLLGVSDQSERQGIITRINAVLALIQNKFITLIQEIGDLFYKVLFEGPMGSWLITLIQAICSFLDWLFSKLVYVVLCFVRVTAIGFLQTVAKAVVAILNGVTFGALGYLNDGIDSAIITIQDNVPCSDRELWSCNLPFKDSNNTVTTLPLPTRCWAGVEPGINSLACTAADTCLQTNDYSNIICGACPVASSMTQFGCDTLTKLCTCSVFPVGISACSSNEECQLDDPDVNCKYVDSYLQPSYGNVPCSRCPKPICLLTGSTGMGQCSCLLRPIPNQPCTGVGQRVSPDASQLCLAVSSGSSQAASNNAYTQNYRSLMSVPCMLINQAQSFCMNVYTSASVSTQLVVGIAVLSSRRRLLWHELISNGTVFLESNTTEWEGKSEPCRSLTTANVSTLGILEKYTRNECWRWYEVGARLVIDANMTSVSPFLLVSWRDLLNTMLNDGSMIEIMAKLPTVIHHLLLHSDMAQPVYLALAYWIRPDSNIWKNSTVLTEIAQHMNDTMLTAHTHTRRLMTAPPSKPAHRRRLHDIIDTSVSAQTIYEWDQGPYAWPPNFVYWNSGGPSCAVVSTAINTIKNGLDPTIAFYQSSRVPTFDPIEWPVLPIKTDVPHFDLTNVSFLDIPRTIASDLTDAFIDKQVIQSWLTNVSYMQVLKSFIQCNFTRVQTCENRKPLFGSAVQFLCIALIISLVARMLGVPYVDALTLIFVVPLFMYSTYGYSPTCIPLVPTCLFADVLEIMEHLLPSAIVWPQELVTEANCNTVACMRSCTTDPVIGFSAWNDHLAWIMCEINPDWATNIAFTLSADDPLRMSILRKCTIDYANNAQRICFVITFVNIIPLLLIVAFLAFRVIPGLICIAIPAIQFAVNIFFALTLFLHHSEDS